MPLDVAGGLGIPLTVCRAHEGGEDVGEAIEQAAGKLVAMRLTAVNLRWGVDRVKGFYDPEWLEESADELILEARSMVEEDERIKRRIGELGAGLFDGDSRVLLLRSSKAVNKGAPPVPRRFGWSSPHPRAGLPV